jgi:four helix bundle protein
MPSQRFEDVEVWKKAHRWVLGIYRFAETFPKIELFALGQQLRRAAVSVPANFAEGFKKRTNPDKCRFYNIAQGSLEECRYYLILARDLGYGDTSQLITDLEEVSRMLEAYSAAVTSKPSPNGESRHTPSSY